MKILIISNMYPSKQKPYSGIFVKNQFEFLCRNIKNKDSISIFYMKRTFTNGINTFFKYIYASFRFIPFLFKKFDIIHLHFFLPLIILPCIYKVFHPKTKIIVTFHGSDINKIKSKWSVKFFSILIKKVDFIISVGVDLKNKIEVNLNKKVNLVLSAGIDENVFYYEGNIEKKYDFIFVGSFIHRKGVDILINTIKRLNNKEISFCFVGSGEYLNELKKLKTKYNIHIFQNQTQSRLRTLYNQSKFLIFPSRDEPFGLIATESLFCGTPIIVSKTGGLKEQLIENKTGYFATTEKEILNIINKAMTLTNNEYLFLKNNALKANKNFSLKNVCYKLYQVYEKV